MKFSVKWSFLFSLIVLLVLASCGKDKVENKQQKSGKAPLVSVVLVANSKMVSFMDVSGTVQANAFSEVKSQTDGIVTQINARENQHVEQGKIIAVIDPNERVAIIAHNQLIVEQLEKKIKIAESNQDGNLKSLQNELAKARQNLEYADKTYQKVSLLCPMSGMVTHRYVETGNQIGNKEKLLSICDLSSLVIKVELNEKYFQSIKSGKKMKLQLSAYPNQELTGTINMIYPEVNQSTRSVKFDVKINDFKQELLPGMSASLKFPLSNKENIIAIPTDAILKNVDNSSFVFIVDAANTAHKKSVITGADIDNKTEIMSGVSIGEQVVVKGQELLKDNMTVTVKKAGEKGAAK